MTLHLHRAERADRLVSELGVLLSTPLPDPFSTEIVCVPTPGVERWISQELSRQLGSSAGRTDGVCAGIEFGSPRRLVARILGSVLPCAPEADPWQPQRSVWPLLAVIDGCRGESWAELLWSYLGDRGSVADPVRGGRRWSTARHLADLFARYGASRPAMIDNWRQGLDVDADGRPLPGDRVWQAELWRRLRDRLAAPSPPEQITAAETALLAGTAQLDLPERLSVFGATRFDPHQLRVLVAVAAQRDVHLWLPHPSGVLWKGLADWLATSAPEGRRAKDRTEDLVQHRLLAYLGRDSRELQLVLARAVGEGTVVDRHIPGPPQDGGPRRGTLLARLQSDLAANRLLAADEHRHLLEPGDRSIQFHASHGPDRQVEVLRELLVGLLADDPTLEPRDIVVMCPDIETFAPLIAATFGLDSADAEAEHPGHRLRVRLADRSLRQLNPLLATVARLVGLAESRMEASALLDLCATAPVSRKFGFRTEDLERLHELVVASGVRWGLDGPHRARYGMDAFAQNTWTAGLDRLLLGVAMDETDQHFIGTTLPMDDIDSSDVDLIGRLAECVNRIRAITDACGVRQSLDSWVELFKQALQLLTAVPPADSWQLSHAYAELGRLADDAESAEAAGLELGLAEMSALLAETFRGRPTRANFRTGTLTMCTMLPMRSVPHRVVCLLGVDDGVFPRPGRLDGDDLTETDAWVGDRDIRSEDRQLLLDAIMSAEERLLVIYAGLDPRSGKQTPPAVPVSELLETLDLTACTEDQTPVHHALTLQHPLQPFDGRYFLPDELVRDGRPFSFDRAALRGVRAAGSAPRAQLDEPSAPMTVSLAPLPADWQPTLADLLRFLGHPLRALLRDRAGLSSWREDDQPDEQIPATLAGLDRWAVGERMLGQHLRGQSLEVLRGAEWRRGSLPPRLFGQQAIDGLTRAVTELAALATPFLVGDPERFEVVVDLGQERLTGSVARVFADDIVRVSFSRLSAKSRLQSWVELLALTVAHPERSWRAVTIGTGGRSVIGPVGGGLARVVLADLIDLQRSGLAEPIPFAPKTSAEYARVRLNNWPIDPNLKSLDKTWNLERDALYEQFFGAGVSLETLLAEPSRPNEVRGTLGEPSRFGTLARRVFQPLLDNEDLR